jgi:hypothetical protein
MAHTVELSGPDLAVGIPFSDRRENEPLLGPARREVVGETLRCS